MSHKRPDTPLAQRRRAHVITAAITEFAERGFLATTVTDVARAADLSSAYVFKLFSSKERLFVAALDRCFDLTEGVLTVAADASPGRSPIEVLDAMGEAYANLIADRSLLMLQVHAQSAASIPEVGAALRRGLARMVTLAKARSAASDREVQQFMAFGQLCHLVITARLDDVEADWAALLSAGIRHPQPRA